MPNITINGNQYEFEDGLTIIQACDKIGVEIPRFCYHDKLSIAGNCRMCLVEVSPGPPKPQASCALPIAEGMVVKTDTPMVKKAREGVMEFLLINHPLDCPICDQGGECDLQDQAMTYGDALSRYDEHKRSVPEKYFGPLIKTFMNRCIHCTRCVRFSAEIAGVDAIGGIGRGEDMEIGTYIEKAVSSELSGNLIDICPVGALTNKPMSYHYRPWELKKVDSIDVMDAVGSNIRVDVRGSAVLRILPRLNEDINEDWISDKTRFACDGLKVQRLDKPMVRLDGKLTQVSWDEALRYTADKLNATDPKKIAALAGNMVDVESVFALKDLMDGIGTANYDSRIDGAKIDAKSRVSYLFNTTIAGLEQADFALIVGSNPRHEAPLVNARIRKRYLRGGFDAALLGVEVDLSYPYQYLGNNANTLKEILDGKSEISKKLKAAKNPVLILGMQAISRDDGDLIMAYCREIANKYKLIRDDWNGFNVLNTAAGRVGSLDVGFVPQQGGMDAKHIVDAAYNGDIEVLYLHGVDEIDTAKIANSFVIYQGHHGDKSAHVASVIFPSAAYTEKDATYVNLEGRPQRAYAATAPLGDAKEDWRIIRALAGKMGFECDYDNLSELRDVIEKAVPHLAMIDEITPAKWQDFGVELKEASKLSSLEFEKYFDNFYMTDCISRASKTMAACVAEFGNAENFKEAA